MLTRLKFRKQMLLLARSFASATATGLAIITTLICAPNPVEAQGAFDGPSYVTPFPENDTYRLLVVGDGFAEGLLGVFHTTLNVDARVSVQRERWRFQSLLTTKFNSKLQSLDQDLKNNPVHIAVIMIGQGIRRSVQDDSGFWHKALSAGWREVISKRIGELMRVFQKNKVAVYWVGMPTLRGGQSSESARVVNEVARERAYLGRLKFIDIYTNFADEFGNYSPYGPDLTGKIRLLRERDGMHFTYQGNLKLAHFVERELKRDLKQAKSERSVPLAGAPKEQSRLAAKNNAETKTKAEPGWAASLGLSGESKTEQTSPTQGGIFGNSATGELKADDGSITLSTYDQAGREEKVTLEIIRPAIPASVVALVTRKQSTDRLSRIGDTVVDQIAGGLSIMSTVTPAQEALGGGGPRGGRLSPAQTPFFRVLFKGERTTPKPGRADDYSWPRPEAPPLPKPIKVRTPDIESDDGGMPLPPVSPFRRRVQIDRVPPKA